MKKKSILLIFSLIVILGNSQTIESFFKTDTEITWLGVDFSHVKLIGEFAQFSGTGTVGAGTIKNVYFSKWNHIILNERIKYDVKGMLQKEDTFYDIDMITEINANTPIEEMETLNAPKYTINDIKNFISNYKFKDKEGIGVLFLAESLNKSSEEAYFHFIAINMENAELLIHERLKGKPLGVGLRNYWAGSMYSIIKVIMKKYKKEWRKKYL